MKHIIIHKNRTIALLLLMFLCGIIKGQSTDFIATNFNSYYFNPQNIGLSTPQSSDFIKYGNLQIDHYNGLLNMGIELDGYEDKDFHLPMSIKYVSSGFTPTKRPSTVGYNWLLNFGGAITRTVKGSPDDTKGKRTTGSRLYIKDGLLVAIRNSTFVNYSQQELVNLNMPTNSSNNVPHPWGDFKYDFEPDIFNFSFGAHSGSFIIGNNGTPTCLSGKGYKIDITALTIQEYSTTATPQSSTIKITTPDGYIYEFGGNSTYLEYFIPNNPEKLAVKPRHIISWYLKSVTAPNNRNIQLTYESKEVINAYNYFLYSKNSYSIWRHANDPAVVPPTTIQTGGDKKKEMIEVQDKVYVPVIKTVTIDNGISMSFQYSNGPSFIKSGDYSPCLTSVHYYANSVKVKEVTFNYITHGSYFFLQKLKKDDQIHNFSYNLSAQLPSPKTISVDHWGFWNGGYETTTSDIETYCMNILENRNSSGSRYGAGLLTKITYPTGGTTEVVYEPNTYNKYIERDLQQIQLNRKNTNSTITCGGARVKQIKDYHASGVLSTNQRTFRYSSPQIGIDSGTIGSNPKYASTEFVQYRSWDIDYDYENRIYFADISSNTLGYNENLSEYHIGYSNVVEQFNDGSSIHYQYTSHEDVPNSMEGTSCKTVQIPMMNPIGTPWIRSGSTDLNDFEVREKSGLYISNDLSHFRGKLKLKTVYSSAGVRLQTEVYSYNINSAKSTYNTSVSSVFRGSASYRIYLTPCLLLEKEVTDAHGIIQKTNYTYNNYSLISEEKTTNSDSKEFTIQYSYPTDYSYSTLGPGEKLLFDKNILSKPLTIKKNSSPNKTLESLQFIYKVENSLPVLSNVKRLNGSVWKTIMEYPRYDSYGNPIHVIENGSLQNVYLWSYKGQNLIAQITNASYTDVNTKASAIGLNLTTLTASNVPTDNDLTKLNTLRTSIPKAQVTTYKYKPLIGIETVTDARDFTTYYDYDTFNRLKEIYIKKKNGAKETLETYKYNYINQ